MTWVTFVFMECAMSFRNLAVIKNDVLFFCVPQIRLDLIFFTNILHKQMMLKTYGQKEKNVI